ncbi:MAG: DUF3459 domain-containing protein [Alphaproteobacteria bacterium]|nr:MAG: DUF3459 domain-containing protein [Alphaproteobacteria bacterium]
MQAWWQGAVIYQIYPRSFADTNGDGIGDLAGIEAHLDHVASLGVDAVWLSPFFVSPMHDGGYDVADMCDVDPIFGTLEDFDRLTDAVHARGMKLIIDQVYSHTSNQHPWFRESRMSRDNPKADWYVWADPKPDGTPPNNWQSIFIGPAWTWDARRQQYYLHNFLSSQPDLNLHQPAVQDALLDVARFWLERGVDGFRMDAANFYMHDPALRDNPPAPNGHRRRPYDFQQHLYNRSQPEAFAFIARIREAVDRWPERCTVAEIGDHDSVDEVIAHVRGRDRFHTAYSFVFLESPRIDARILDDAFAPWQRVPDAWPSWAFSNHDAPRVVSRWARDAKEEADPRFATALNVLLCALKGTIFLYQGQELGLPQADVPFEALRDPEAIANWPETLGRDGARTPMPWRATAPHAGFSTHAPWLPVDPRHAALAVDRQEADAGSPLNELRRFLSFRRAHPALRHGAITITPSTEPLIVFSREDARERLTCVFNLEPKEAHLTLSSFARGCEPVLAAQDVRLADGVLELPAYGWAVLGRG